MGEKMRIYVGGLGSCVREDDLKKTFGSPHLGTVESVEINRNKGRSFGYMEFVPATEKALAKLFSTYNGCMWKGGKLRLEKAKEHYLSRLGREWAEDAELAAKFAIPKVDAVECAPSLQKFKGDRDVETHIRIFFPKLRKIKPLPLKGSGKHKYSFQRVQVPPLPVHFCDCEEHSGSPESAERSYTNEPDKETSGVDEEELNIMKSVLGKLMEKENRSNTSSKQNEFSKEMKLPSTPAENFQIGYITQNQVSDDEDDDDDVVINVACSSNRAAMFEDWGQFKSAANQDSLVKDVQPSGRNQKREPLPDKKRKVSSNEHDTDKSVTAKKKAKKESSDVVISKKSAWKNMVTEKGSTAFHISDILTGSNTDLESRPKSALLSSTIKDGQNDQSNKTELEKISYVQSSEPTGSDVNDEEMEDKMAEGAKEDDQSNKSREVEMVSDIQFSKSSIDAVVAAVDSNDHQTKKNIEYEMTSDVQSNKSSASEDDKSGRGAAWRQKSSWIQLITDSNKGSFSIGQILPDVTFEKQEIQSIDFSSLNKQLQEEASKDAFMKEQNLDGDKVDSDVTDQKVEQKDEVSDSVPKINSVLSNRGQIVISETCPFMKSADSMKVWAKTKAALSVSLKKKGKAKQIDMD